MPKLTTTETRAREFMTALAGRLKWEPFTTFPIEWRKSPTWGHNPQVYDFHDKPTLNVSGCGYCKKSTALAELLCWLPDLTDQQRLDVRRMGGTGVSTVVRNLPRYGWHVRVDESHGNVDIVILRRATYDEITQAEADHQIDLDLEATARRNAARQAEAAAL